MGHACNSLEMRNGFRNERESKALVCLGGEMLINTVYLGGGRKMPKNLSENRMDKRNKKVGFPSN